jgi:ribonuclease P protein component
MAAHPVTEKAAAGEIPPAALSLKGRRVTTLRHRADFLRAARARKVAMPGFILQIRDRKDDDPVIRVGFTCSKKVGNAVDRNRARRRLREVARLTLPQHGRPGHDYVLIGRAGATATQPFDRLLADLRRALA